MNSTMKRILTVAFAVLFAGLAFAQNRVVVSPQAIVVNPIPSFEVDVFFERNDRRTESVPTFDVGSSIRIGVQPSEDAYVYIFDVRPDGTVTQILPNRFDPEGENNFIPAGNTRFFPPRGARYTYQVEPPRGLSKVIAVASTEQLDTRQLASFQTGESFATSNIGQEGFASAFSIVVRPIDQNQWVTNTALYYVGERNQAPQFATLSVESEPNRAEVFLDGEFIGLTPLEFGARPGRHEVRIERDGYLAIERTFNLRPGETLEVEAELQRIRREAEVDFRSTPSGADVYIDGSFVGVTPLDDVLVSPGTHEARFTLDGYESMRTSFSVVSGESTRVNATLRQTTGSIRVQANVGGAQVFLDGRAVGSIANGTGQLTLAEITPGVHQLTVVAPGYTTYVTDVNVVPGQTATVQVRQNPL